MAASTHFAMVEELASIIKDNLYSKHLVLSTEETLIDFLQNKLSTDGIIELQPVGPYHRLLLHRLADIYGFAHESVGEGDERHLVLVRCPETAMPAVLVSDLLWQYDCDGVTSVALCTRKVQSLSASYEKREVAYQAARDRIFGMHDGEEKESASMRPRKVPIVARRMIAHALGQRIQLPAAEAPSARAESDEQIQSLNADINGKLNLVGDAREDAVCGTVNAGHSVMTGRDKLSCRSTRMTNRGGDSMKHERLKREQAGAAKRMFAHALGLPSSSLGSTNHAAHDTK